MLARIPAHNTFTPSIIPNFIAPPMIPPSSPELHAVAKNAIACPTRCPNFAAAFRHTPFGDAPWFRLYELASGPLNAGVFPNPRVDPTLGPERLLYYAPADAREVTSFAEARRWFSFGVLDVAADGALTARIVNGLGEEVFRLTLDAE